MGKLIKRTLISRECASCKISTLVRKDGAGKFCRSCKAKENHGKRFKNITGMRSGKLKVIKPSHKIKRQLYWECVCDCGNTLITSGNRLRSGKTKSCGCITAIRAGLSTTPTYRSWKAMIERCYNPKNNRYVQYGARGIKVCDKWLNSFADFVLDMGLRPKEKTLDRINTEKDYYKDNCRWATNAEQGNNKRNNLLIEYNGIKATLTEWSVKTGIHWSTLRKRIIELKWPLEKALQKKKK